MTQYIFCRYIATQWPLDDTIGDFWRMVSEYSVPCIINLSASDKDRHATYLPDTMQIYHYDFVQVRKTATPYYSLPYASISCSTVEVKHASSSEWKRVHCFNIVDWCDFGIPHSFVPVLHLIHLLLHQVQPIPWQNKNICNKHPLVVHCSAGCGRTGTFIALHHAIARTKMHKAVDWMWIVKEMRTMRMGMVQSAEQYQFLQEAWHVYQSMQFKE